MSKKPVGRPRLERTELRKDAYEFDPKKIINWSEVSRRLTGREENVTKIKIPHDHVNDIARLLNKIIDWNDEI